MSKNLSESKMCLSLSLIAICLQFSLFFFIVNALVLLLLLSPICFRTSFGNCIAILYLKMQTYFVGFHADTKFWAYSC